MKRIVYDTDFNKKLGCKAMIHIGLAPKTMIKEEHLNTPVIIGTKDGSFADKKWIFVDILRFPFSYMPCVLTLASHGMRPEDFKTFFTNTYPGVTKDTELAAFYYLAHD